MRIENIDWVIGIYGNSGEESLDEERGCEVVDRDLPNMNSAESIIKALYDDEKLSFIEGWVNKLELMIQTLNHGFDVDFLALKVVDPSKVGLCEFNVREIDGER